MKINKIFRVVFLFVLSFLFFTNQDVLAQQEIVKNHYKTWRLQPVPFSAIPQVKDQFMTGTLELGPMELLSNPVKKMVGEVIFPIIKPDNHLTWYRAFGKDTLLKVE